MTDTTTLEASASSGSSRRSGALSSMRLAELQGLASSMGITGTAKMRKGDLVTAIRARQNGESGPASDAAPPDSPRGDTPDSGRKRAPSDEARDARPEQQDQADPRERGEQNREAAASREQRDTGESREQRDACSDDGPQRQTGKEAEDAGFVVVVHTTCPSRVRGAIPFGCGSHNVY